MSDVLSIILRSFEYGSIYAFAAFGIILIYRTSYTTNFAQGVIGMFVTFAVAKIMKAQGLNIWVGVLIGILLAILMGILIDVLIMRHSKKVNVVGKQIITLGILMIIIGIQPFVYGVYPETIPQFIPQGRLEFGGAGISYNALFNILSTVVVMLVLLFILLKTKIGLAIRATASNENTARLMGIPTKTVTMLAWAVAAALSLLAGVMAAPFGTVHPGFMNDIQINAFMALVLGGFSTFYGPVAASFLIAVVTNLLQVYLPTGIGTVWGKPIVYILILVFLIFKPQGLFGKKMVKKV